MHEIAVHVLSSNIAGNITLAEHGLSLLIEAGGYKILFDTGQSDLFMRNAEIISCSLADVETIILSHGHFDHGNGLIHLNGGTLVCHPGCFVRRYRAKENSYIGLNRENKFYTDRFDLVSSVGPHFISENVLFLGEIPRLTEVESRATSFKLEDGSPDYIFDDSAVAVITRSGLFLFTGCGHSGIINTMMHAKKITGINKIVGIMGGFHLKDHGEQTRETIRYLQSEKVKHILPMHCTELPALSAFYEKFRIRQVRTGDLYTF